MDSENGSTWDKSCSRKIPRFYSWMNPPVGSIHEHRKKECKTGSWSGGSWENRIFGYARFDRWDYQSSRQSSRDGQRWKDCVLWKEKNDALSSFKFPQPIRFFNSSEKTNPSG